MRENFRFSLVMLLLLLTVGTMAQELHVTGNIYKNVKRMSDGQHEKMPLSAMVYVFDNRHDAQQQFNAYRKAAKAGSTYTVQSNDQVQSDYDGHFEADVASDGALMVVNELVAKLVPITSKLTYDIVFQDDEGFVIDEVVKEGKRTSVNIQEIPPIDDGQSLHWNVNIALPPYYMTPHSRLIFQPVLIDCQEGDTLQYLEPEVFEGTRYHYNQINRKTFDCQRNDSLAPYLQKPLVGSDSAFAFRWQTVYPKPNPDKSYKWGSILQIEDYTHVRLRMDDKQGTCNSRKPWKMLDASAAMHPITLDKSYYEQARAKMRQVPRDLQLTFKVGTDELTPDSANQENLRQMVDELKSYGRTLMNFTVQGTASPEGRLAANTRLANKRAQRALQIIGRSITSAGMHVEEAKVYTWQDVADSLQQRGMTTEAGELRSMADQNDLRGITAMMGRTPAIQQVLQNQRLMKCTYTIRLNKVLEPKEVLWNFYNSPDYAEGTPGVFSNGDYYHLFQQIKDSAELRRLTLRAYKENAARRTAVYSPFAAYLANRMACYMIAEDSVNTSILAPFIDMKSGLDVSRPVSFDNSYRYIVNRKELVANQAIMLFRAKRLGEAAHLAAKLPKTKDYEDIHRYIDLETLFFKANKTPEEQRRADSAFRFVENSSASNRAVLHFELAKELGETYDDVRPLIDSLSDDNPRKWYMLGVVAAEKPGTTDDDYMSLVEQYGSTEALRMMDAMESVPDHLAYFQHAFDLNPRYYGFYATDANISDDVRKKYPYDASKAEAYRAKFKQLMSKAR